MTIHDEVLTAVNQTILPYVMRVHQTGVPYPAELWAEGDRLHANGVATFEIGVRGFLTAEYFGYDNIEETVFWTGLPPLRNAKIVMKEPELEIPIWWIQAGQKARTRYSMDMPDVQVYECDLCGWVGGAETAPVQSADLTLSGVPNLSFPRSRIPVLEESTGSESVTLHGIETKRAMLTLECDEWRIRLREGGTDWERASPVVSRATLSKKDGSVFTLGEDKPRQDIVDALFMFLSFQSGRWVGIPTIICYPPATHDRIVKRAWLGKLSSDGEEPRSDWTAAGWRDWPNQFEYFWKKYANEETHAYLLHGVQHYVDCSRIFHDGAISYSMVAAISTLQALTRWWNDLGEDFHFTSGRNRRFNDLLTMAVELAGLGGDHGKQIEPDRFAEVISQATDYRNLIDHGQGGATGLQTQAMVDCQMYCHNLSRLLLLAQFGDRGTHQRGYLSGPHFVDQP